MDRPAGCSKNSLGILSLESNITTENTQQVEDLSSSSIVPDAFDSSPIAGANKLLMGGHTPSSSTHPRLFLYILPSAQAAYWSSLFLSSHSIPGVKHVQLTPRGSLNFTPTGSAEQKKPFGPAAVRI